MNIKNFFLILVFLTLSLPSIAKTTDTYIADSQQAIQKGEFKAALIHLKNAAKEAPKNIEVNLAFSDLYLALGRGDLAQIAIQQATKFGAAPTQTQVKLIKALLLQQQLKKVIEPIDRVLKLPILQIAQIRSIQGQAYLQLKQPKEAKQFFRRAFTLEPDDLDVKIGIAKYYLLENKRVEAKQLIESLAKENPHHASILLLAGIFYRDEKNNQLALDKFEAVIKIQPTLIAARLGSVYATIGLDDYKKADVQVKLLLSLTPESEVANYLQASIAMQLKDTVTALQALQQVQKINPNHLGALWLSSNLLYQSKDYDKAEAQVHKLLNHQANHSGGLKLLATIYLAKQQANDALALLKPLAKYNDADVYALLGSTYLQQKNKVKGIYFLKQALKLEPDNQQVKKKLYLAQGVRPEGTGKLVDLSDPQFSDFTNKGYVSIIALLKKQQTKEAIELLLAYQKSDKLNPIINTLLGQVYTQEKQYDLAFESFNQVLKTKPQDIKANFWTAKLYVKQKQFVKAERHYKKILGIKPKNLNTLLALSDLSRQQNDIKKSVGWLEKATQLNPHASKPKMLLNQHYLRTGQLDSALALSKKLLENQPDNVGFLKMLGDIQMAKKDISLAMISYKKVTQIEPRLPHGYFWLAKAQYQFKQFNLATQNFRKAIQLGLPDIKAFAGLVNIALMDRNITQASKVMTAMLKRFPEEALSHELNGDISLAKREPITAVKFYNLSLKKQPKAQVVKKRYLAQIKYLGNEKAQAEVERWLLKYPDNVSVRQAIAVSYLEQENYPQAISHYEKILKHRPKHVNTINNLALLYDLVGNKKSIEFAEVAYSLAPKNATTMDTLGWLLLKSDFATQRAVGLLEQAVTTNPSNTKMIYHYAKGLSMIGEKAKAKSQLNLILPSNKNFANKQEATKLLQQLKSNP